jgi:glycosyltransferase involved in cell wall biosynthesis
MKARQRLCFVLPEYSPGTSSHLYHTGELLEELAQRLRIYLFVERWAEYPSIKGVEQVYLQRFRRFPWKLLERFIVFLGLRLKGYHTFYIHISHFSALLAALITRVLGGRVYYWNCGLRKGAKTSPQTLSERVRKKLLDECAFKLTLKMINFLVTGTPLMARHYSRNFGINLKKIKVVPNSINLERFRQESYSRAALRQELAIGKESKVVLFVHWLSERKGAHYLAKIIGEVTAQVPNAVFVIVGDGPYREKLVRELDAAGLEKHTKLIGSVPNAEVPRYYALADLFIMPSTDEGFPRVLLEAMAMGVPFVAIDVGGVRDILTARQLEFVTAEDDLATFTKKVIELLDSDSLREELRQEGLVKVREFDREAVANLLASTLTEG